MNTFHKILFVLAILIANCISASAIEFTVDRVRYSVNSDNTTVTVAGYPSGYNKPTGDLTIPDSVTYGGISYSVTSIGKDAFRSCTGLTNVTIGNSVTSIGDGAFYECSGLTSLTIPNSVTSIGNYAFGGCSGLTSVTIGNSVTSIGRMAFYVCSGLMSVTIPNSVTSIGNSAFYGTAWYNNQPDGLVYAGSVAYKYKGTMPSGTSIVLKEGTKGIADEAFYECSGLTSLTIPNSVTSIGEEAFYNCSGLTSVTIPNSVTSIGQFAFSGTAWYNNQPDGLVYAGLVAYQYKGYRPPSGTSIALKEGTKGITEGAFYNCSGLTSVTIPNSVTTIGEEAFYECSGLTSLTIGNSVISIGDKAFYKCSGLTSVTIGNSVTSIGNSAFYGCSGLTSVVWNAKNCSNFESSSRPFKDLTNIKAFEFGSEVERIPAYLCYSLTGLKIVTIGNSVTEIGNDAFRGCYGLTSVTIPNSVTSIGYEAFKYCSGLMRIDAYPNPEKVSTWEYAFEGVPKDGTLHVLPKYLSAYQTAGQWCEFTNIKGNLTEIGDTNLDGKVDVADVTTLMNMILN